MSLRLIVAIALVSALPGVCRAVAPVVPQNPVQVRELIRRLDSDRFMTRHTADEELRAIGKGVLPFLREELARTKSVEVRYRLERMVHDLTMSEHLPRLLTQLANSDVKQRQCAEYTLRKVGSTLVPLLREELKPDMPTAQRVLVEQLIAELSSR